MTSPGSILLEATFFINVVSSLPDVTLDFKEIEQKQVLLTSGKSEITLKGKDADQYPRIQEIAASNPLVLETKLLKQLINETAFAASVQESRPILTGVHFVLSDNKELKTVATDSHRMSQKSDYTGEKMETTLMLSSQVALFVNSPLFFLMILKQLRFSLLTIKFSLEVNTLVFIPVC